MNKNRKLVAVIACRNNGSRLYGKPLQNLDILKKWTILDQIIDNLYKTKVIDEIVLAISFGKDNLIFEDYSKKKGLQYIFGSEIDVLQRLNIGLEYANGTDLFRVTSESPFLYIPAVENAWINHKSKNNDATFLDDIIDGCGFEIINSKALKYSWDNGIKKHRSEMCSLYIRENKDLFKIEKIKCPNELIRPDLRLTVDYPEDLIFCREVYRQHIKDRKEYDLLKIVALLNSQKKLISLISPYCEEGYKTMYL